MQGGETGRLRGRPPLSKVGVMLRFRLGSIPVEVHPSHLLFSGLLAWSLLPPRLPVRQPEVWPYRQLLAPDAPGYAGTVVLYVLAWMLIVFVAALVHQLGHALAGRAFGYRPSITLMWLGGTTRPHAPSPIPWLRRVAFHAAGPLFGLLLGAGAWLGKGPVAPSSEVLAFFLDWTGKVSLVWTFINLLPVLPLAGGHITSTLAVRVFGPGGFLVAQGLALLVCLALVAFALSLGALLFAVFFGLYGFQAVRLLSSGARGELPGQQRPPEPLVRALREGKEALASGRLEEARRKGVAVLEAEQATPELASQAHHLLGWVALKEGQGRGALDHFSQVHRQPVETHALAAAFSLIGDEPRALALWELAARESKSPTVLHEYAGSLIRSGREQEALRLEGVEPETAFLCAERPLFIRGAYSEAAALAEAGLTHVPSARLAYETACAYARARHTDDAVRLLQRATELGFQDSAYAASDEDLAPLHGHPRFEQWLVANRKSA